MCEHPADILREYLEQIGMTPARLALKSGLNRSRISEILHRKRPFTVRIALALEKALPCVEANVWARAQVDWDIEQAKIS